VRAGINVLGEFDRREVNFFIGQHQLDMLDRG
jgi:hypothetical protein